jgi:hypothetical protein
MVTSGLIHCAQMFLNPSPLPLLSNGAETEREGGGSFCLPFCGDHKHVLKARELRGGYFS